MKDDQTIDGCGIKANDFLVVMVTKPKKAAAAPAAAAPAPAAAVPAPAADASKPAEPPTPSASAGGDKAAETPAASSTTAETPAAPSRPTEADFPAEVVSNLTGMGFPEAEVRHCLRAANGNPDIAVEFLTNGIPPGMQPGEQGAASPTAGASGGDDPLAGLRNHPQFNDLRRLVQSNPQMLQTVLTQIGQQQPELLAAINANQEAFLTMMNEPITESSSSSAPANSSSSSSAPAPAGGAAEGGIPAGMLEGMANPAQMAQMIQGMSPNELNQMAAMMGLSPDQLRTTAQMLGQIPPEQLQQYMMQAMQGGGGGLGGMMGGAGGGGGGGQQVLRLTEEEMAAVDRLTEMGFDRTEAAQAFLACDKNEALAANLLMDSMGDGGFFGGGGGGGGGGGSSGGGGGAGGGSGNSGNDDGDDMYD